MGRAIVRHPQVFLFDEPLSNLDAKLRVQMRTEIKKIHQKVATTIIYVTHDQVEAMTLADRTVVMDDGNIQQVGTPQELYETPATRFVAGFIGSPAMNFIPCKLAKNSGGLEVLLEGKYKLKVPKSREATYKSYVGKDLTLGIRPEHLTDIRPHKAGSGMSNMDVKVEVLEPMGVDTMVFFSIGGADLCARVEPHSAKDVGQKMTLTANMNNMHLLDPESGNVIGHTAPKSKGKGKAKK
jgi:multiple sugar transport system ATP-binding protein